VTATARLTTAEVASVLVDAMGGTLIAALAGAKDRKLPYRWRSGAVAPRLEAEVHLRAALDAWWILTASDSEDTARAWFIGCNPHLGDAQPFMALREGRLREVLAAARAFVSDGQAP